MLAALGNGDLIAVAISGEGVVILVSAMDAMADGNGLLAAGYGIAAAFVIAVSEKAGVDVFPVDIGMVTDGEIVTGIPNEKSELTPRTLLLRKI